MVYLETENLYDTQNIKQDYANLIVFKWNNNYFSPTAVE